MASAAAEKQPHSPMKTLAWSFGAAGLTSAIYLLGEREEPLTQEQAEMMGLEKPSVLHSSSPVLLVG
jgi:hypothetical protein